MHAKPAPTAVIADDERLMREQIVGRLKEAWPELLIVGEASNGREAVAMVKALGVAIGRYACKSALAV